MEPRAIRLIFGPKPDSFLAALKESFFDALPSLTIHHIGLLKQVCAREDELVEPCLVGGFLRDLVNLWRLTPQFAALRDRIDSADWSVRIYAGLKAAILESER
jgi:hypothetical protein